MTEEYNKLLEEAALAEEVIDYYELEEHAAKWRKENGYE